MHSIASALDQQSELVIVHNPALCLASLNSGCSGSRLLFFIGLSGGVENRISPDLPNQTAHAAFVIVVARSLQATSQPKSVCERGLVLTGALISYREMQGRK